MAGGVKIGSHKAFDEITDKMKIFVSEYVVDLNGKRAAEEAGYSAPAVTSGKLLKNPKIQKAIEILMEPSLTEADITKERVLAQLAKFGFHNIIPYLDSSGNLKCSPEELPEDIQQCIVGLETINRYTTEGELIERRYKLKTVDKMSALSKMLEYLQLLKSEQNVNVTFDWGAFSAGAAEEPVDAIETIIKQVEEQ